MRLLFALLAVMAMLASPVMAASTCDRCDAMTHAASSTPMGGAHVMDMANATSGALPPCCDPSSKHKPAGFKGCAQMCAAMTALAVGVIPVTIGRPLTSSSVRLAAPTLFSARSFEPLGLKRPPKRIA